MSTSSARKWTKKEDTDLAKLVASQNGTERAWKVISEQFNGRTPEQCRQRWQYVVDPTITKEPWSLKEDRVIIAKQAEFGNKWSKIATFLPGRTDKAVRDRWRSLNSAKVPPELFESPDESLEAKVEAKPDVKPTAKVTPRPPRSSSKTASKIAPKSASKVTTRAASKDTPKAPRSSSKSERKPKPLVAPEKVTGRNFDLRQVLNSGVVRASLAVAVGAVLFLAIFRMVFPHIFRRFF